MALVKLLRGGQLTLPAETRRALRLREGDNLEAEVVDGGVLLRPVAVVDREQAWDKIMAIIDTPKWREPPTMSPEEEEEEIYEIVREFRRRHG